MEPGLNSTFFHPPSRYTSLVHKDSSITINLIHIDMRNEWPVRKVTPAFQKCESNDWVFRASIEPTPAWQNYRKYILEIKSLIKMIPNWLSGENVSATERFPNGSPCSTTIKTRLKFAFPSLIIN